MCKNVKKMTCMAIWLAAALPILADDTTVTVEANRNQLYLGESFILQVNVTGADNAEADISLVKNGNIRGLGKQNISNVSISFVNGQVTRQGFSGLIISYEITPLAAGLFQAGPVIVNVNNRSLTVDGPTLTVTDIEKQDVVKLAVKSSNETVLIDEPFDITLTVQVKRLPGKFADVEPLFPDAPPVLTIPWLSTASIPGLNGPDINQLLTKLLMPKNRSGFAINDFMQQADPFDFSSFMSGNRRRALFALNRKVAPSHDADYVEYSITLRYSPKDEGNYVFGPVVFKGSVPVKVDDSGKALGMAIFAVGPARTVRVIPPPELNRPACFSGAIGSNLTVTANLDTNICSIGDPLKLTLQLNGEVRFDKMLPPKLTLQTNLLTHFTVYDNTVQSVKGDNSCQYIYTLRPTQAGAFQVPPIEVAYYDLKSRTYKTIQTQMIPIAVKRGTEITASQIEGNTNPLSAAVRPRDDRIQPIAAARTDANGAAPASLLGHPAWLVAVGAGPGLFVISLMIRFYRRHDQQRRASVRRKQALPQAWRRLDKARKLSALDLNHPPATATNELCDAIRHYLADRLEVPAPGITPKDARQLLLNTIEPAQADAANELCLLFEHYFNSGFASLAGKRDIGADCRKLQRLLRELDRKLGANRQTKNHKKISFLMRFSAISFALFACTSALALDVSERTFIWDEAQACMAAAKTPEDYRRAAQTYQKLVNDGVYNGPLFYNLGTALLQASELDPAIAALQHAEQFLGAQHDIRQNLKIAMARKSDNETAPWPWYRLVMSWHFYLSAAARMIVVTIAFSIFWAVLALRLHAIKHVWLNAILIMAAVVVILFGSSVITTWQQDARPNGLPLLRSPPVRNL